MKINVVFATVIHTGLVLLATGCGSTWPPVSPRPAEQSAKASAVVVGVGAYPGLKYGADFADADADLMVRLMKGPLGIPEARIHRIQEVEATSSYIEEQVARVCKALEPDELFWFYFAGHAWPDPKTSDIYLLGRGARQGTRGDGYDLLRAEGIRLSKLEESLSRCGRTAIVILDSCFSGQTRTGELVIPQNGSSSRHAFILDETRFPVHTTVIRWAAASGRQYAASDARIKHGVFTYFLGHALNGAALPENTTTGSITLEMANQYVQNGLDTYFADRAGEQTAWLTEGHSKLPLVDSISRPASPPVLAPSRFAREKVRKECWSEWDLVKTTAGETDRSTVRIMLLAEERQRRADAEEALAALRELADRAGGLEGLARLSRLLARVLDVDIDAASGWSSDEDGFG